MSLLEKKISIRTLALLLLTASTLFLLVNRSNAVTPGILSYQGRVLVNNAPFSGTGQFKFALVNAAGSTTYWSNDATSTAGSEPTSAVPLTVTNGLYSVLLGDTTLAGMTTAVPTASFSNGDARLRVWVNDGTNGSKLLAPDQRIAPVGYALVAASVDAGAVTSAMIAPGVIPTTLPPNGAAGGDLTGTYPSPTIATGAVTAGKIADGAVTVAKIASGVAANGIALTANGSGGTTFSVLPKARAFRSTSQSLGLGGFAIFDSTEYNIGPCWNPANPTRLTAPQTGYYLVSGNVKLTPNTGLELQIVRNGGQSMLYDNRSSPNSGASGSIGNISGQVFLNAGDYVELSIGASSSITTFGENANEKYTNTFMMAKLP